MWVLAPILELLIKLYWLNGFAAGSNTKGTSIGLDVLQLCTTIVDPILASRPVRKSNAGPWKHIIKNLDELGPLAFHSREVRLNIESVMLPSNSCNFILSKCDPAKVNVFGSRAYMDRIHSKLALRYRNIIHDSSCQLCGFPKENTDHILLNCDLAKRGRYSSFTRFVSIWSKEKEHNSSDFSHKLLVHMESEEW